MKDQNLLHHKEIFEKAERLKKFISIDMADGDAQTDVMEQLIETYPDLRIAIGTFWNGYDRRMGKTDRTGKA